MHIESVWDYWNIDQLFLNDINLWLASPARFVACRIAQVDFPPGLVAMRRAAVEAGLAALAFDPELPVEMAAAIFRKVIAGEFQKHSVDPSERVAQVELRRTIESVVAGAIAIRQYGLPLWSPAGETKGEEHQVSFNLGLGIPVVDFLDLKFLGGIVMIHSVSKLPLQLSAAHARQCAFQSAATGFSVACLYVAPTGAKLIGVTEIAPHLATLRNAALRLANFLAGFATKEHLLAACPPPDLTSKYWSSPTERAIAQSLFGISS